MADFEVSDLALPQEALPNPNSYQKAETENKQMLRDKSIAETSPYIQHDTWFKNVAANSVAAEAGKWLGEKVYTDFKDNPEFGMDDEGAMFVMNQHQLPMEYYADIRSAKSDEELSFRVNMAKQDLEFKTKVENQLTYDGAFSQASTSAFVGQALDDVTIGAMSGGIGSLATRLLGTSRGTAMAIMADVSLETGLAAGRYMTKDNHDVNDVFMGLTLGLIPSSIIAYKTSGVFGKLRNKADDMNSLGAKVADDVHGKPVEKPKDNIDLNSPLHSQTHIKSIKIAIEKITKMDKSGTISKVLTDMRIKQQKLANATTDVEKRAYQAELDAIEKSPEIQAVKETALMLDDTNFVKEMAVNIKDTVKQLDPEASKAIIDTAKKELGDEVFDAFTETIKTGDVPKNMSKGAKTVFSKKKLAALAILTPAIAEASDDDIKDEIYTGAIMLALGAAGYNFIRSSGGLRASAERLHKTFSHKSKQAAFEASPEASKIRQAAVKLSNVMDTELTNTKSLFLDNKEASDLIDKLIGKGETIDMDIRQQYESAMAEVNRTMRDTYTAWSKSNPDGTLDEFNKLASEYIDNMDNVPFVDPNIARMVDTYHAVMERMYNSARASGAKGFEKFKYTKDMLPRLWKTDQMRHLLQSLGEGSDDYNRVVDNLRNAFVQSVRDFRAKMAEDGKEAFKGKTDEQVANLYTDKFIALWTNNKFSNFTKQGANTNVKDIKKFLIDNKIIKADEVDLMDELIESLVPASEMSARAKRRVVFNPKYLEDMTVTLDNEVLHINKTSFVERDLMQIVDTTSKELAITSAYAKKGFKTRSMLDDEIVKVAGNEQEFNILSDYKRLLEGRPTLSNSPFVESFITLSRAAVSVAKLSLVGFSTLPEFMNVLARGGLVTGLSALTKSMLKAYKPDGEVMQIRNVTGLASFNDRLYRKGYIGYDELNDKLNPNKALTKFAKTAEDWAYTINRLGWITDVVQLAGIEANMKQLRKFAKTGNGLPTSRLEEYGITKRWMNEFGELLKSGDEINMNGWTNAKKNRFGIVLKSLNQSISPETMLHTKGLWTSTNTFGRATSSLLNYSATVFNEQGLPLLRHTDRHSVMNNINAFSGAFIGLNLKYALEGKEVDQEDILTYALTGTPLFGALGMGKGVLNPATLSTTADVFNMLAPDAIDVK